MKIHKGDVLDHGINEVAIALHDGELHDTRRDGVGVAFFCTWQERVIVLEYEENRRVIANVGGDQW